MGNLCACPEASLTVIPDYECREEIGIIRKFAFCREKLFQGVTTPPTVTTLKDLTEWATTLNATDDTLTIITPICENAKIEPGDVKTAEYSQATMNNGVKPAPANSLFLSAPKATIAALKKIMCSKTLYVYFFNEKGDIVHAMYETTKPGGFKVMPYTGALKDTKNDATSTGLDENEFMFQIEPDWSSLKTITTPSFDPLTDLVNGS